MRAVLVTAACLLVSCRSYSEFQLPPAGSPASGEVALEWQVHPEPVLTRSTEHDRVDALNPSIVRHGSMFWNVFSGYDGRAWHTLLARSPDGMRWRREGVALSPDSTTWEGDYIAANGTALFDGGRWLYWYQGNRVPRIGLATSRDGLKWTRHGPPVIDVGPRGSWDERGVADPYVIRAGDALYMYYLGQDRARRQRLGVARSSDGVRWTKLLSNPVLELGEPGEFDETGLGEPAVWAQHGWYWMLYTARDRKEWRRIGLARSQDGVRWTRVSKKPVLVGEADWNRQVVCDPTVLPAEDGSVHVWFGGGNRPEPAENLNGQIGYARLRLSIR